MATSSPASQLSSIRLGAMGNRGSLTLGVIMNLSLVTLVYADPKHVEKPSKHVLKPGLGGAHQRPRTSNSIVDRLYPKRNRLA